MSDGHEWCRDVRRDEQVRAAEDAAAVPAIQHRDLPEQVALVWASLGDLLGRVVRLEGEFDAGQDEEAAPAVCDSAHLDAHRGESVRVVEAATIGTGDVFADVQCGSTADEIARLTAERDAAILERDEARASVAELEAAPAANAGGDQQEPVAWGVLMTPGSKVWRCSSEKQAQKCVEHFGTGTVVPLYAAPVAESATTLQPPRGWLTAEEREQVQRARDELLSGTDGYDWIR